MIDGNQLREEFGRYLAEHKATRWGMDAALMHVCKIAYDAGKADGPGAAPLVQNGEVLVTVTGLTGSGKSAIAGEIEIMCRALGPEAIAELRAELAASREREARMRGALRNLLALDVDHQRGADDEDVCAEVREARAALAEGAQG